VTLPGEASLEITVMDYDGIADDTIGVTTIDLEDRWFTPGWRDIQLKPLERRTLHRKTSSHPEGQGKLECWVELMTPEQAKKEPMWDITPPPPLPYEIRVIAWGCRNVTIKDELTNQNDLYITCASSEKGLKEQETDIHWRSKKGKGNFNWRMKYPINLQQSMSQWPRLRFQIWDYDLVGSNDSICETVISLKGLCLRALKAKDRTKLFQKGKDRIQIKNLQHPNFKGNQGEMEISLEILPASLATQLPAGLGRGEPNMNPFLPEPEGRVNWSLLHPLDMAKEILGDLYDKIFWGCCVFICLGLTGLMVPMIASGLIARALTP